MAFDPDFKPVLRFMNVSDIHIKDEEDCVERARFAKAIRLAYAEAEKSAAYKGLDALIINGDFANSGSEVQMRAAKEIIDANIRPETMVRLTMASHEYFCDGEENARARFAEIFGTPLLFHEVIRGFHFIGVTTTRGCRFDDREILFTRNELKKAAKDAPQMPIFFFQHPHLSGTVYGSIHWGDDPLIADLMNYPQVINFSGHSHAPVNDPRSIHQDHFTSVGSGTLSYFELDEFDKFCNTLPPKKELAAQMLLVEADAEGRVRVYPYDVLTEQFFPQVWKIDTPWDPDSFLYTDVKRMAAVGKPAFTADTQLAIETTDTTATVSFKQAVPAENEDYVDAYLLVVKNADTGLIVKQIGVWSEYYFYDMPDAVTHTIDDLDPGTAYTIDVIPEGFFRNRGAALKGAFRTK